MEKGKSEYKGVVWSKKAQRWYALIHIQGKQSHLGSYASEEDAARRYDEAASPLGKPLNFPAEGEKRAVKKRDMKGADRVEHRDTPFQGVRWNKQAQKWHASILLEGKQKHLGSFENEVGAVFFKP